MRPERGQYTSHRITRRGAVVLAALLAVAALIAATQPSAAQNEEPDPIEVELLAGPAEFTDDVAAQIRNKFDGHGTNVINLRDASHVAVAKVTIQPEAVFPWHTHPGPVLITVAEGAFTYVLAEDCVHRTYGPGEAVVDAGGDNVHTALNPNEAPGEETVVYATFLGADGPLTVPVDGDQMDELDDDCGIDTPRP